MKRWKAILTDGSVHDEGLDDPGAWRRILNHAREHGCSIESLEFDGKEVDDYAGTSHYFVINDILTNSKGQVVRLRKGFGSLRINGKARIKWCVVVGHPSGSYTEITTPENNVYNDLGIEIQRPEKTS